MKRLHVHTGMPKTGTSSIQKTLFEQLAKVNGVEAGGWLYLPSAGGWNHGPFLAKAAGIRNHQHKLLTEQIARHLRGPAENIVISAENLSNPSARMDLTRNLVRDLAVNSRRCLRAYIYLRPFRSYIASQFVQKLKIGAKGDLPSLLEYPFYRLRLNAVSSLATDHKSNLSSKTSSSLSVRPYSRKTLTKGDVTLDFCHQLGLPAASVKPAQINESLSLEAVGILYYDYTERMNNNCAAPLHGNGSFSGRGRGFYRELMAAMLTIGNHEFKISSDIIDNFCETHSDDLRWVYETYGIDVDDTLQYNHSCRAVSLPELSHIGKSSIPMVDDFLVQHRQYDIRVIQNLHISEKLLLISSGSRGC